MGRELRLVTDAARELRAWIKRKYPTGGVPRFCEEKELDRIAVQRALNGEIKRISVDFAFEIQAATGGTIKAQGWRSETGRAVERAA